MLYYLPHFEKQLTGSVLDNTNCGAASGAMLIDQATLGDTDPTPEQFRRQTGDLSGGLHVGNIATACEEFGIPVTAFDSSDDLGWFSLRRMLLAGRFAVVAGDYDVLPIGLRGDKDFEGWHSVFFQAINLSRTKIRVGDPLNDGRRPGIPDGWIEWPIDIARDYVERFGNQTGGGIQCVVMDRREVEVRAGGADVYLHPRFDATRIGTYQAKKRFAYGSVIKSEPRLGNRNWFSVWVPKSNKVGYIHGTRVRRV